MRRVIWAGIVGCCAAAVALAGCGGGTSADAPTKAEKPYVDAATAGMIAEKGNPPGMTHEQFRCVNVALVKGVGVNGLEAAGMTPAKLADAKALDKYQPTDAQLARVSTRVPKCKLGAIFAK